MQHLLHVRRFQSAFDSAGRKSGRETVNFARKTLHEGLLSQAITREKGNLKTIRQGVYRVIIIALLFNINELYCDVKVTPIFRFSRRRAARAILPRRKRIRIRQPEEMLANPRGICYKRRSLTPRSGCLPRFFNLNWYR